MNPTDLAQREAQFVELYGETYAEPPYFEDAEDAAAFGRQLLVDTKRPGFAASIAEQEARLVGFAYGFTFGPQSWWQSADHEPHEVRGVTKFAVMEWIVRSTERRRGIGRQLLDTLLVGRREPWFTLCANPIAPAHEAYRHLGWQAVAVSRSPNFPAMDVLLLRNPNHGR